jgi:DNA-binding CsgD family transcriptional regulator
MKERKLTQRQTDVLKLLCKGKTSKEIGEALGISPRTVDVHRKDIRRRLNVPTVPDLMRYALRKKLISLS